MMAMALSGCCALLIPFAFGRSLWLLAPLAWAWGFFVIADSAQFSALVTESVPPHAVGTALTVQTSIGFLLTMVSIQLIPPLVDVGWMAVGLPGARNRTGAGHRGDPTALVRVRRSRRGGVKQSPRIAIALVAALVLGMAGLLCRDRLRRSPSAAAALVNGSFGSWYAIGSGTLVRATPLILTGLAVAIAFRAGVFNIGAEGQFIVGAAAAAAAALALRCAPAIVGAATRLCRSGFAGGGVGVDRRRAAHCDFRCSKSSARSC